MKAYQSFPYKKAYYGKGKILFKQFFLTVLWAGTGTVTCQKSEPEP